MTPTKVIVSGLAMMVVSVLSRAVSAGNLPRAVASGLPFSMMCWLSSPFHFALA